MEIDNFEVVEEEFLVFHDSPKTWEKVGKAENQTLTSKVQKAEDYRRSMYQAVELWVGKETNKSCVRFFKPFDSESDNDAENEIDRFCLLLMTKPQIDFLKTFSQRLVCVDHQSGENFTLLALLVLDDKEQCIPCALFFTEYLDLKIAKVFFTEVEKIVGNLCTNLLLSDNDCIFYAWDQVMGPCKNHMMCSWDVVKDWELNLLELKNKSKKEIIIKELENIIAEKDINCFTTMFSALMQKIERDSETEGLASFVQEQYCNEPQNWASCYRFEDEGAQGFSELDKVHTAIEFILQSKSTRPMIKSLVTVLDYFRTKIYDRLLARSGSKVTSKMYEMSKKHKVAGQMVYSITRHNGYWSVVTGKKENHIVKVYNSSCQCQLRCDICSACSHTFACTCVSSMLKLTMCRHIHAVCISEASAAQAIDSESNFEVENLSEIEITTNETKDVYGNQTVYQPKLASSKRATYNSPIQFNVSEGQYYKRITQTKSLIDDHDVLQFIEEPIGGEEEVNEYSIADFCEEVVLHSTPFGVSSEDHAEAISSSSIVSRKDDVKNTFKSILNQVENEEDLVIVEKTVSSLQKNLLSTSAKNVSTPKRKVCTEQQSPQSSSKCLKIFGIDGKPLKVGQPVVLKYVDEN